MKPTKFVALIFAGAVVCAAAITACSSTDVGSGGNGGEANEAGTTSGGSGGTSNAGTSSGGNDTGGTSAGGFSGNADLIDGGVDASLNDDDAQASGGTDQGGASGTGGTGGDGGVGGDGGTGGSGGNGGVGGTGGAGGSGGSGGNGGSGGTGGSGGSGGTGGSGGSGGAGGTGGSGGAGGSGPTCGELGQACCDGSTCSTDLECLNGVSCSCAKSIFSSYVLRTDGKLLQEVAGANGEQTPIVDTNTGLPLTNVVDGAGGLYHGCAALSGGTVACWRTNARYGNGAGQLGIGTTDNNINAATYRSTQVLIAANTPLTNVKAMAVNEGSTPCAVTNDGKLYCWGDLSWAVNNGTQLYSGYAQAITTDGGTTLTGVIQASTSAPNLGGDYHSCAIIQGTSANEVWCWGANNGFLGVGDNARRQYPTKVLGLTNPTKVVAGQLGYNNPDAITCALDGANVRCWGYNTSGEAGVGSTNTLVSSPQLVTVQAGGALGDVIDLYPGGMNFCALLTGDTLWCWGWGYANYAANYGVTNIVAAAWAGTQNRNARFLTSDGLYHIGTATRTPNCGAL